MNLQSTMKYKKARTTEEQWTALYCRLSCDDDSNARCLPFVKYIPAAPPFLRA